MIINAIASPLDDGMVEIVPTTDSDTMPGIVITTSDIVELIELMRDSFTDDEAEAIYLLFHSD